MLPSGSQLLAIIFPDKEGNLHYLRRLEIHKKRDGSGKYSMCQQRLSKAREQWHRVNLQISCTNCTNCFFSDDMSSQIHNPALPPTKPHSKRHCNSARGRTASRQPIWSSSPATPTLVSKAENNTGTENKVHIPTRHDRTATHRSVNELRRYRTTTDFWY
jgi:hypothetical protein